MDYSPPGSSSHGISQARIPEWVTISYSISFSKVLEFLSFLIGVQRTHNFMFVVTLEEKEGGASCGAAGAGAGRQPGLGFWFP